MQTKLQTTDTPELIFGLVAPIGVDLDLISEVLHRLLGEMEYSVSDIRLTSLMREVPTKIEIKESPYIRSFKDRIRYANKVRKLLGDEALAAMAVSAIRNFRADEHKKNTSKLKSKTKKRTKANLEEIPLPAQAYIIRQFKRPEEISLLRGIYGRQFIVISCYSPENDRQRRIEDKERESRGGLAPDVKIQNLAHELVAQDANESIPAHGQNVRDAFPLGDVFIDASSRSSCERTLRRFIYLLFGDNHITPTHDEYGMYMAKSASLRSSDLSRQVGAAIFRKSGEVISLGCNEVPKAGGGTYWSDGLEDRRDFVEGFDANERRKKELVVDFIERLRLRKHLSKTLLDIKDSSKISQLLLSDLNGNGIKDSQVMDLLEFGRAIHAEMSAICDAARIGESVVGAKLFSTTFPCHICAKHIVAAGLNTVVYLEPYPKSYATDLHSDSIDIESSSGDGKVRFEPFIGVSPYRYRDLFEKGRRKYSGGNAQKWHQDLKRPMIEIYNPSYFEAELVVVTALKTELEDLISKKRQSSKK